MAGASLLPTQPGGGAVPPPAVTFGRKRGADAGSAVQQNGTAGEQPKDGAAPASKRGGSQRLGGLAGPVGSRLLGTFSKRQGSGS